MGEQSVLAYMGIRLEKAGSPADLAYCAPVLPSSLDPGNATAARRTGGWFDTTAMAEVEGHVVGGKDASRLYSSGAVEFGDCTGADPGLPYIILRGSTHADPTWPSIALYVKNNDEAGASSVFLGRNHGFSALSANGRYYTPRSALDDPQQLMLYNSWGGIALIAYGDAGTGIGPQPIKFGSDTTEWMRLYPDRGMQLGGTFPAFPALANVGSPGSGNLFLSGNSSGWSGLMVQNQNTAGFRSVRFSGVGEAAYWEVGVFGSSYSGSGIEAPNQLYTYSQGSGGIGFIIDGANPIRFGSYAAEWMRIFGDGGVQIGDVYGTSPGYGKLRVKETVFTANIALPTTSASEVDGVIFMGTYRWMHAYGGTGGYENLFLGSNSGNFTNVSTDNVGVGQSTLQSLTIGSRNTIMGKGCGSVISSGSDNSGFGFFCFQDLTTGEANSAFGRQCGANLIDGGYNALYGAYCAESGTSFSSCAAIGVGALYNMTGSYNTAAGHEAGQGITTATYSTFLGYQAGKTAGNFSYSTAIGALSVLTANNQIMLGTATENVVIPGTASINAGPYQIGGAIPSLQMNGTAVADRAFGIASWGGGTTFIVLACASGGVIGTHGATASGINVGAIGFNGSDGTNWRDIARIDGMTAAIPTGGGTPSSPGRLRFSTTPVGSVAPQERMRIWEDGGVQIGGTYVTGPGSGSLSVSGFVTAAGLYVNGGISGYIRSADNEGNWLVPRDSSIILATGANNQTFSLAEENNSGRMYWFRNQSTGNVNIQYLDSGIRTFYPGAGGLFFHDGSVWRGIHIPTTVDGGIAAYGGSAGSPGVSFQADTDTGMFSAGADAIGFAAAGVEQLRLFADGGVRVGGPYTTSPGAGWLQVSSGVTVPDGTTTNPTYNFASSLTSGFCSSSTNSIQAITSGAIRQTWTASRTEVYNAFRVSNGTAAAPAIQFAGSTTSGLFQVGTNIIGMATAATERMRWYDTGGIHIGVSTNVWDPGANKLAIAGGEIQFYPTSNTPPTNNTYARIMTGSAGGGDVIIAPRTNGGTYKFRVVNGTAPTTSVGDVFIVENYGGVRAGMTAWDAELPLSVENTSTGTAAYTAVRAVGNGGGTASLRGYNTSYTGTLWGGSLSDCSRLHLSHGSNLYGFVTAQTYLRLGVASAECLYLSATQLEAKVKLMVPDGTAALPAISFYSAVNTGVYLTTTFGLGIITGGTEKARFWGNGGVQIGGTYTSSPGVGNLFVDGTIRSGSATGTGTLYLADASISKAFGGAMAISSDLLVGGASVGRSGYAFSAGGNNLSSRNWVFGFGAGGPGDGGHIYPDSGSKQLRVYADAAKTIETTRFWADGGVQVGGTYTTSPGAASLRIGTAISGAPATVFAASGSNGTMQLQATNNVDYSGLNMYDPSGNLSASFQYGNPGASVFGNQFFIAARKSTTPIVFAVQGSWPAFTLAQFIYPDGGVQFGGTYGTSLGVGNVSLNGYMKATGLEMTTVTANPSGTSTLWTRTSDGHLFFGATDLSAGGGTIGGTIGATQVGYGSATDTLAGDAGFIYEDSQHKLTVSRTDNGIARYIASSTSNGAVATARFDAVADVTSAIFGVTGSGYTSTLIGVAGADQAYIYSARDFTLYTPNAYALHFGTSNLERMRIYSDGGVQVGNAYAAYGTSPGAGDLLAFHLHTPTTGYVRVGKPADTNRAEFQATAWNMVAGNSGGTISATAGLTTGNATLNLVATGAVNTQLIAHGSAEVGIVAGIDIASTVTLASSQALIFSSAQAMSFSANNTAEQMRLYQNGSFQHGGVFGSSSAFLNVVAPTNIIGAVGNDYQDICIDLSRTYTFGNIAPPSNMITTIRAMRILGPTYASSASNGFIGNASTLYLTDPVAGANVSMTNPRALEVNGRAKITSLGILGAEAIAGTGIALGASTTAGSPLFFYPGVDPTVYSGSTPAPGMMWYTTAGLLFKDQNQVTYNLLHDTTHHFGDPTVDGSWKITVSGTNLLHQRRESGVWVTKHTVEA